MHGFSPVESDRLGLDHLKQHQHQHQHQPLLNHGVGRGIGSSSSSNIATGHDFIKNIQQHVKGVPPPSPLSFGENRHGNAKGFATADNIAISDVSSNEQMLYFSNDNVKGNYARLSVSISSTPFIAIPYSGPYFIIFPPFCTHDQPQSQSNSASVIKRLSFYRKFIIK